MGARRRYSCVVCIYIRTIASATWTRCYNVIHMYPMHSLSTSTVFPSESESMQAQSNSLVFIFYCMYCTVYVSAQPIIPKHDG